MLPPLGVPIDLDRDEARRQALAELADPDYRTAQPTWLERVVGWLVEQADKLVDRAIAVSPGGWWGVLGLLVVIVAAILVIRWRIGPVARSTSFELSLDPGISAEQYRQRADTLAQAGDWAAAVSERMRAIVRGCEERGLVEPRAGRTADEMAADVARRIPEAGSALAAAVGVFDRVRYGSRPADRRSYDVLVTADRAVSQGRIQHSAPGAAGRG